MRKKTWFALLFITFAVAMYGQTKNQRDASGRKQGYWEATDRNGALVYTGHFKDDKPVGELKRYYPTGEVRVIMNHLPESTKVRVRFFWQNGGLASAGNYIDTQRDSVWLYFSFRTKTVSRRVEYSAGQQNGKEQVFYPDGHVAEEVLWKNGQKNGHWRQFFNSGQAKLTANYVDGQLEGAFTAFAPDGKTTIEGAYRNGKPDSDWKRYDEDGNLVVTVKYSGGVITNQEEVEAVEQKMFETMMEQAGKIPQIAIEDLLEEGNW